MVKTVALAPIPNPRTTAAVSAKIGVRRNERTAKRRSRRKPVEDAPRVLIANRFLHLSDASELECGSSPRLLGRQTRGKVVGDALVDVKLELLVDLVVTPHVFPIQLSAYRLRDRSPTAAHLSRSLRGLKHEADGLCQAAPLGSFDIEPLATCGVST